MSTLYARVSEEGGIDLPFSEDQIFQLGHPLSWYLPLEILPEPAAISGYRWASVVTAYPDRVVQSWSKVPLSERSRLAQLLSDELGRPLSERQGAEPSSSLVSAWTAQAWQDHVETDARARGFPNSACTSLLEDHADKTIAKAAKAHRGRAHLVYSKATNLLRTWMGQRRPPVELAHALALLTEALQG